MTEFESKKRALLIGTFATFLSFLSTFLVTLKIESIFIFLIQAPLFIAALALENKKENKIIKIALLVLAILLPLYFFVIPSFCIGYCPSSGPFLLGTLSLLSQVVYFSVFIWAVAGSKAMWFWIKILSVLILMYIIINVLF